MKNQQLHELLPWYVNGSLSAAEQAEIEQNFASDDGLKTEEKYLAALRQQVLIETCDSPGVFGLQRLRREIQKESKSNRYKKWRTFSIAASLLLVVQLGVMLNLAQKNEPFVPLSGDHYHENIFQLQFKNTVTADHITKFLLKIDAVIIDGPSVNGIYRIRLQTINDETLSSIRRQNNIVEFIAEE